MCVFPNEPSINSFCKFIEISWHMGRRKNSKKYEHLIFFAYFPIKLVESVHIIFLCDYVCLPRNIPWGKNILNLRNILSGVIRNAYLKFHLMVLRHRCRTQPCLSTLPPPYPHYKYKIGLYLHPSPSLSSL